MLFLIVGAAFASADGTVVANTKDWRAIYLTALYAQSIDAEFYFFNDLSDAQLKTKLISKSQPVLVFEQDTQPVMKNYDSFLDVNGFDTVRLESFSSIEDLQEKIIDLQNPSGLLVLDDQFGVDAIIGAPYAIKNNYSAVFMTPDFSLKKYSTYTLLFAGQLPIRKIDDYQGEKILGTIDKTSNSLFEKVLSQSNSEWGVITQMSQIDFDSFASKLPLFVYYSQNYHDFLVDAIKKNDITKFEVIGGDSSTLAKNLESESGKDLDFMLKYGQKITNDGPHEDTILQIDSLALPFPIEKLVVLNTTYYPALNILAVTFRNTGNVDLNVFSSGSFLNQAISDEYIHQVQKNSQKTIPFTLEDSSDTSAAAKLQLAISYGLSSPLPNSIHSENNSDYLVQPVVNHYSNRPSIQLKDNFLDTKTGDLTITYHNDFSKDLVAYTEFIGPDGKTVTSKESIIPAGKTGSNTVNLAYISNEDLVDKVFQIYTYYGEKDTLLHSSYSLQIKTTSFCSIVSWPCLIIILVLVFFTILLYIFMPRKRRTIKKSSLNKKSKKV